MGERLKRARLAAGLSRKKASKAIGVHLNTILNWEDKGVEVPSSKIPELANLYGCTVDYLFGIVDDMKSVAS